MENFRVLLTGGTGFIGYHILPHLVAKYREVWSLERYVTGRPPSSVKNVKTIFGDIRDYKRVQQIIKEVQPDGLIHLAAISPVSYSFSHPHEVMDSNFIGTINLAEACYEIPHFKHMVFASTSEVYGNQKEFPIIETMCPYPNTPYSVSKLAGENYLRYMKEGYNFPVTICRNFNTFGRKRNKHFVIEKIITQMIDGKDEITLGNPEPIRDFQYVDAHVSSYLTCLNNPKAIGETFNFCSGREISIKGLVDIICDLTQYKGTVKWNTIPRRPCDIKKLRGSYSKVKRYLGWEPQISLEEGLRKTIEHWRKK